MLKKILQYLRKNHTASTITTQAMYDALVKKSEREYAEPRDQQAFYNYCRMELSALHAGGTKYARHALRITPGITHEELYTKIRAFMDDIVQSVHQCYLNSHN